MYKIGFVTLTSQMGKLSDVPEASRPLGNENKGFSFESKLGFFHLSSGEDFDFDSHE